MRVSVQDLSVSIGDRQILKNLNIEIESGSRVAIVGPNGSGKTTLLRALLSILKPSQGQINFDGVDISNLKSKELAGLRSVVPQAQALNSGLTVLETIELAQLRHERWWQTSKKIDKSVVDEAIQITNIEEFLGRRIDSLSGGEKQKVFIARAIAQRTPLILLDEPTNHLDPSARIEILEIIQSLNKTRVMVLHDLDLALSYADYAFVINNGECLVNGIPEVVFESRVFTETFKIQTKIVESPFEDTKHNLLTGKKREAN